MARRDYSREERELMREYSNLTKENIKDYKRIKEIILRFLFISKSKKENVLLTPSYKEGVL